MPDPSSSHDDPFADLFSKLPDPRERDAGTAGPTSAPAGAAPSGGAPETPPRPEPKAETAPLSRREARAAAAAPEPQAPPLPAAPQSAAASAAETTEPAVRGTAPANPPAAPAMPAQAAAATAAPADDAAAPPSRDDRAARATPATPTLDELFTDAVHDGGDGGVPKKRRRRIGGWIALGIVLVLLGGAAAGGVWVWNTYEDRIRAVMGWEEPKDYEAGQAHGEALVTIAQGDLPPAISKSMFEAGVTKTSGAFYDMLIATKQNPTFYPGVYKLQKQMTAAEALAALEDPANKLENSALLREGLTEKQILPILADSLGLPIEDFEAAVAKPADYGVSAKTLEGWLFPAMYTFDPGVTAKDVITTLVERTKKSLDDAEVPEDQRQKILTIASIIQREARFEDDFYKVSRVIYNRLDPKNPETFGLLQMDSTAQYGYGEMHDGTVSSSAEALADDNAWNTYKRVGLPAGPIANPGDTAIDAAMHPADGAWLYFVTVNLDTGETVFTKNLAAHNKAVKQWQQWCAKNPDSGC